MLVYMESFNGEKKIGTVHHDDAYVSDGKLAAIPAHLAYVEDDSTEIDLIWEDASIVDVRTRETAGVVGEYRCVEITEDEAARILKAADAKAAADIEAEAAEIREIISACERQTDLPSREEAERRMTEYNNVYNEGREGFVPHIYSREEYIEAKDRLNKLKGEKQ